MNINNKTNGKDGKNKTHINFLIHNILGHPHYIYKNLKSLAQIRAVKSVTDFF